jgi:cytochrome c-type biogenesis protein CcmE
VAAALLMVIFGISLSKNLSTYSTFDSAKSSGKTVHIAGEWVNRQRSMENENLFQFYVRDSLDQVELVKYYDPKPNNFEQAERIVLVGRYDQQEFVADKIITKCPSKYGEAEVKLEE